MAHPIPTDIRLKQSEQQLLVRFDNGEEFSFSSEFLRVHSPSAEVQGHGGKGAKLVAGKASVAIVALEPVGHYAIKLIYSDGHSTGLYTWELLYRYGQQQAELWQTYLTQLAAHGLSR